MQNRTYKKTKKPNPGIIQDSTAIKINPIINASKTSIFNHLLL